MGDALVRASKLVNQYPHLPSPKHAITSERRALFMLSLSFGYGFDALRNLCVWAESFGAWVQFGDDGKRMLAELDLGGQQIEVWCGLLPPELATFGQLVDVRMMPRAEPVWLMSTLDNQPQEQAPADASTRYWPTAKVWAGQT
jgi:hypothetical protein